MLAFVKDLVSSWFTAMSGVVGVLFWGASAVLAAFSYPVPVYIGFLACGLAAMFCAAYGVWAKATARGEKALANAIEERKTALPKETKR